MSDAAAIERLRRAILNDALRMNRERTQEAWISIAVGITTMVILGAIFFWLAYLLGFLVFQAYLPMPLWAFALLVSALFLGAGWWSAARRENALAPLVGHTAGEYDDIILFASFGVNTLATSRFAIAGFSELLSGGPRQLIDGRAALRTMLPSDDATARRAATLLAAAIPQRSLALNSVPHDDAHWSALILLRRALYIVPGPLPTASRRVVPTPKAIAIAEGTTEHTA